MGEMAASFTRWVLSITLVDGAERTSVATFYVKQADAVAYNAAADDAARDATTLGQFIFKYTALTDMYTVAHQVGKEVVINPPPGFPADDVLRGNKLSFSTKHGGLGSAFTVPGRDATSYTQMGASVNILLDSPTNMDDFVTAYNATIIDAFGNASTIISGKVVD
jgi:hypothetical protein